MSISDLILRRSKTRYFTKWMASLKLRYGHAHAPPFTLAVDVKRHMTQFPTSDLNRIMAYSVAYRLAYLWKEKLLNLHFFSTDSLNHGYCICHTAICMIYLQH
jgi:hypothetical protein